MNVNPSNGKLTTIDDHGLGQCQGIRVQADLGDSSVSRLEVINDTENKIHSVSFKRNVGLLGEREITQEQAMSTAMDLIRELNIDDEMVIDKIVVRPNENYYKISYVREVSGVRLVNIGGGGPNITDENADYTAYWPFERLDMMINDLGIINFDWESPYHINEMINDDDALMPFDQVAKRFEEMFFSYYNEDGIFGDKSSGDLVDIEFNIAAFQLRLMRLDEKDNPNGGFIAPVWLVYESGMHDIPEGAPEFDAPEIFLMDNQF